MPDFLGIDTSNYTTSAAIFRSEENRIIQVKKLLPVKNGELGLRQSDAVFHHTRQLPQMISELFSIESSLSPQYVSVSVKPRNADGSYMPCFLCGEGAAEMISTVNHIPLYKTSHQIGHILAALYSANAMELVNQPFIAFHVSGGTTDCLLCRPDKNKLIDVTQLGTSLDLKAGQAVDRIGLMLGLEFPCGQSLETLAAQSNQNFRIKPTLKGNDCCLSGLENKCRKMIDDGFPYCDIAMYCLCFIAETIMSMTDVALKNSGKLPLVYAGGVMSDAIIRDKIISRFESAKFAKPVYSSDNAAGIAIYGYLCLKNCTD